MPFGACPSDMFSPLYGSSHSADHLIAGVSITYITFNITDTTGVAQSDTPRRAGGLVSGAASNVKLSVMWSWHVKVPPVATFWAPNFTFICSVGTAAIRRLNPLRGDTDATFSIPELSPQVSVTTTVGTDRRGL